MQLKILSIICVLTFLITGCSTMSDVFNPYDEEFMCPDVGYGKCATMDQAYQESYEPQIENEMVLTPPPAEDAIENHETANNNGIYDAEYIYRKRLFAEMASVIEDSDTPLLSPPKIARVLVLNYADDEDTFFSSRYIYFITQDPKWVLAPYEGLK